MTIATPMKTTTRLSTAFSNRSIGNAALRGKGAACFLSKRSSEEKPF